MYEIFFFIMFFIMVYQLIFYMVSIFTNGVDLKEVKVKKKSKVMALVLAHNEENCIYNLMKDLKRQTAYKSGYLEIYVLCDNCTDLTETICIQHGVNIVKRISDKRGKQYAMIDFYNDYTDIWHKYNSIVVFDADSRIKSDYIERMANQLYCGRNVVQSYIENANKKNNIISRFYEINYKLLSGIANKSRELLGLNSYLGGTGYIIRTEVLKKYKFDCDTIVDDLEYTAKLVLNGERVHYTDVVSIYLENPLDLSKSVKQRLRWMRGQFQVFNKYIGLYVVSMLKHFTFKKFDMFIMILNPYVMLAAFLNFVYICANIRHMLPFFVWNISYIGIYILIDRRSNFALLKYVPSTILINLSNYIITVYALFTHYKRTWVRTEHNAV